MTETDGMIESETEMREEIKTEAQTDMMGTKQGHVTHLVAVHTGQPEILRNTNGGEERMKEENKLNVTLQDFCGLATAITGIKDVSLTV